MKVELIHYYEFAKMIDCAQFADDMLELMDRVVNKGIVTQRDSDLVCINDKVYKIIKDNL